MKKTLKSIIFLLIFLVLWNITFNILWLDKNSIQYFFKAKDNTFDVVYIGSSNAYAHFNTVLAYNKYGYTTGLLSTDLQPFSLTKYLIQEAKKHHQNAIYVVDFALAANDIKNFKEGDIRKTIDSMPFDEIRKNALNMALNQAKISKKNILNFYFPFTLYHNRWKEITINNFYREDLYKGYLFNESTIERKPQKYTPFTAEDELIDLAEINEKNLIDLLEYCKKEQIKVLFVLPSRSFSNDTYMKKTNMAIKIIKEKGFEVINFNNVKELNIDYNKDLYNSSHLNVYGSTKYTLYFAKYLKEHYSLPDHRKDSLYSSWNSEYERFKRDFKKLTKQDFTEVVNNYNYS